MKNKNTIKTIEKGRIYITATFNNTIVTVTDDKGSPVIVMSCGMFGFAGTRKSTPHAATITTDAAVKKAVTTHNLRAADVFVKGIGPGREAALRVLRGSDLDIERIIDVTPIPHNGVKQPKIRRV
ncbi:MAG: 30S ribosomal protein S11 [bacterium]|nr:30S ribosomal protein S11 [bacterium]